MLDQTAVAQHYRRLAFRLRTLADEKALTSFVIASALPRDGKTTVACNLAVELARIDQSRSVVLVDMDLRRPSIGRSLGIKPEVGIEAVLSEDAPLASAVIHTG